MGPNPSKASPRVLYGMDEGGLRTLLREASGPGPRGLWMRPEVAGSAATGRPGDLRVAATRLDRTVSLAS